MKERETVEVRDGVGVPVPVLVEVPVPVPVEVAEGLLEEVGEAEDEDVAEGVADEDADDEDVALQHRRWHEARGRAGRGYVRIR